VALKRILPTVFEITHRESVSSLSVTRVTICYTCVTVLHVCHSVTRVSLSVTRVSLSVTRVSQNQTILFSVSLSVQLVWLYNCNQTTFLLARRLRGELAWAKRCARLLFITKTITMTEAMTVLAAGILCLKCVKCLLKGVRWSSQGPTAAVGNVRTLLATNLVTAIIVHIISVTEMIIFELCLYDIIL
jgi:hypothetical protein